MDFPVPLTGVFVLVCCCLVGLSSGFVTPDSRIPMGPNTKCDDGQSNVDVDWNPDDESRWKCLTDKCVFANKKPPEITCLPVESIPEPLHKCMNESIVYEDHPPSGGSHRPVWPTYGTYRYIPPQRWIHGLEHGAAVFLFNPCVGPRMLSPLKKIARSCLRRHIITPYNDLPPDRPFAIVTYGCKMLLGFVDKPKIIKFIKEHAIDPKRAPETKAWKDGNYTLGLTEKAAVVLGSDVQDSILCPSL